MPWRRNDHAAAAVANNRKRPRIELAHVLIVAASNRIDRRSKIIDGGTFQVLRLEAFAGPAPGGSAVITKGTAHAIVVAGAGQQRINFLYCCLGAAKAQLQHPLHRRRHQLGILQQLLDRLAVEFLDRITLLSQPGLQARDLVDAGNGAAGDRRRAPDQSPALPPERSCVQPRQISGQHKTRDH